MFLPVNSLFYEIRYQHSHHKKAPRLGCFFVVRMKPESTNQHASPPGSYIKRLRHLISVVASNATST